MTLEAPNLDDRAFQDLVDEAKLAMQRRCPEWTDHNVADPGVTLVEAFAYMVDQLIYRVNRVPDVNYIKFLDLLGEKRYPPAAAIAPLTFMLAVPQPADLVIPRGTEVSTVRQAGQSPVTFSTVSDLRIAATSVAAVLTHRSGEDFVNRMNDISIGAPVEIFSPVPVIEDTFYLGLSEAVSGCVVRINVKASIEGIGVDPLEPPRAVEVWDGRAWVAAEILEDTTGGFNRRGHLDLHVVKHAKSTLRSITAAWIRFRVIEPLADQPTYSASPKITQIEAAAVGGVVAAQHGRLIENELLGESTGTPGQTMQLRAFPVIAGQLDLHVQVSGPQGWRSWHRVESFAESGPDDLHFTLDEATGTVKFGPAIRLPEGGFRQYGAIPAHGSTVRISSYLVGGGVAGNVEAGALRVLSSAVPFVSKVINRTAAVGGVEGESLAEVKERAAITLRTRDRAVTSSDFEHLAVRAAPSLARVKCLEGSEAGHPGTVVLLVVPTVPPGLVSFELLQPRPEVLSVVADFLDERRCVGTLVRVEPPRYLGASVLARIRARPGASLPRLQAAANELLVSFLHPTLGGYEGNGWPFGRPLFAGDIHAVLQQLPGLAYVEEVQLVASDPVQGLRAVPSDRIEPGPLELLYSYAHEIDVFA